MRQTSSNSQNWPAPRVARWLEYTRSEYGAVDIKTEPNNSYVGEISATELGPLSIILLDVKGASGKVQQTSDASERPPQDFFALTLILEGRAKYDVDGHTQILEAGDLIIRDLARPWTIEHEDSLKVISVPLPYQMLLERLPNPEGLVGQSFDRRLPETKLVSGLVFSALDIAKSDGSEDQKARTASLIIEALSLLMRSPSNNGQSVLLREARREIALNVADPDMCPNSIAASLKVHPKALQRAFAKVGTTVKSEIIKCRIDKSKTLLRNPGLSRLPLTEIAFRAGFNDPNHFSRSFRHHSGQSPSAFRKAALN